MNNTSEKLEKNTHKYIVYLLKKEKEKNVKIIEENGFYIPVSMCAFYYEFDDIDQAKLYAELIKCGVFYRFDLEEATPTIEALQLCG